MDHKPLVSKITLPPAMKVEQVICTGCPDSEKLNDNTNCVVVWCLEKNDQQLCLAFLGQLD